MNDQNPYGGQQQQWGGQQQPGGQGWGQQQQQQQQWGQQPQPQQQQPQWGQQPPHPGMGMPQPHMPSGSPTPGAGGNPVASEATAEQRAKFIERTYMHLAGAIAVFVALSVVLQMMPFAEPATRIMTQTAWGWYAVMGGFIAVSYVADKWARGSRSVGMQYAGLGLYTVAEAFIFMPLIFWARLQIGDEMIFTAGGVTLALFAAMTAYVFITKKDFSFMRGALSILAVGAFGLIIASMMFKFELGMLFSVAMVVLACGYILYYTGNVLHHYRVNQHVAAALALFSAVALLAWYILRIFMSRR